jgi:branched-chain amino acid transport system ATP-binding protein
MTRPAAAVPVSPPPSATILELRGLESGYDRAPVVKGVDLHVRAGEVVALLGGNGAGKTTTLLTISGLLAPLGGEIELFGDTLPARRRMRPDDVSRRAAAGLAHVPDDRGLFFDLTARENLRLGHRRGTPSTIIDEVLDLFPPLGAILDRRAGLLSGGQQQMLAIARALISRPRVLMVDEMSLGLAPLIVEQLVATLRSVADDTGTGILLVEQHVALVLSVADRGYVLTRGRVSASGPAAELLHRRDLLEAGYLGDAVPSPSP